MLNKLNLKIIYKLPANLIPINSPKAFIILTNGYVPLNLINHILTVNKQLSFLKDKSAKAIKNN
jgi:hypothetical protein